MIHNYLSVDKGQYLTDIYENIESGIILHKTLTGLGATYSEIISNRDSIIVVPNVPTITVKCVKHKANNLFGVKERVTTEEVVNYIDRSIKGGRNIKIMVTPESFYKVKDAFEEIGEDMYMRCFLLLDECHKIIKDMDYRPDILLPMDDFFSFVDKALVSATPIIPTDPRFEKNDFRVVEILPTYDYAQEIQLVHTNNMLEAIRNILPVIEKAQASENNICIFVNSTDMIHQLISKLGIAVRSSVFCATKSVTKLKNKGFKNAYENWSKKHMRKFNFFTSRFHTAIDIELDMRPDVVFITEPYFADHTLLDPYADIVQAIGRFRGGVSSVTHVFTTRSTIQQRTIDGLKEYIDCCEKVYTIVKTLYNCAKSSEQRNAFRTALDAMPYNNFLRYGVKDYFAIDNYIHDELVRSSYNNIDSVKSRYLESGRFTIKGISLMMYPFGEHDRLSLFSGAGTMKKMREELVEFLDNIKDDRGCEIVDSIIEELREKEPVIVDAFFKLGKAVVTECGYRVKSLREKLIIHEYREKSNGDAFLNALRNTFDVGRKYTRSYVKNELIRLFELFEIKPFNSVTAYSIDEYFNVDHEARIGNGRAVRILSSKIE